MRPSDGFRRLVISERAEATVLGRRLVDDFSAAARPVLRRPESTLAEAATVGSLVCGHSPPRGWVERAEHGALAVRPDEYYVNPIAGCRSRCTYCFLQATSARLPLYVYSGVDELLHEVGELLASLPRSIEPLLCTGEQADSLADSDIYPVGAILTEELARLGRGTLELRTKSDSVDSLLGLDHRGRTIVAFSLAPQEALDRYEGGTAALVARLDAARRCQLYGYRVALKLEPLHVGPEWRAGYRRLMADVADVLDPAGIDHVAVGSLRAGGELLESPAFRRHHASSLDGGQKIAYRPSSVNVMPTPSDRSRAYRYIEGLLHEEGIHSPIWWSMETREMISALSSAEPSARWRSSQVA